MRYVQVDSHPREDHPFNIKQLVKAFIPSAVVDYAPYSFQKAPDWFRSPANLWTIRYHDDDGNGEILLNTQKREIKVSSGQFETVEFIKQVRSCIY